MTDDDALKSGATGGRDADSPTSPAERALAEAAARRSQGGGDTGQPRPREIDGRPGPEPVRYGDWENKGIASDF